MRALLAKAPLSARVFTRVAVLAGSLTLAAGALAQPGKTYVWFAQGEQLAPVVRTINWNHARPDKGVRQALRFLARGPKAAEVADGFYSAMEKGFRVNGVVLRNGVATIYAPWGIYGEAPALALASDPATKLRIAQVVFTATEFPDVRSVTLVTNKADGTHVRLRNLTRKKLSVPRKRAPQLPLPPWEGPRPDNAASIQEQLVKLAFLPKAAISGEADYRTQQALYAFQAWYRLDRTGVAGDETITRLREVQRRPRPGRKAAGHRMEIHRDLGVLLLLEGNRVVQAVHISTGAGGATPSGSFSVYRKELMSWSVPFSVWLPYASYFYGGMALHSYPDVPPWPASHGCVRVSPPEAAFVYDFAGYGTPIRVF